MLRLLLPLLVAAFSVLPGEVLAAEYDIDAEHSRLGFKVGHLGISSVSGDFGSFYGKINFDPNNVSASKCDVEIYTSTIYTRNRKRDAHLVSSDFLHSSQHPKMTFKSKRVTPINSKRFNVAGDLTIMGVAKPVTLKVTYGGAAKDPFGITRHAFEATAKLKRSDFGVTFNMKAAGKWLISDTVNISMLIEAVPPRS